MDGAPPALAGGVTDGDVGSGSWFGIPILTCLQIASLPPGVWM